ncbi:MAG: hypothetical protein GX416_05380 [Bacteroidales bacterium]|nr:hypothetical protein [Bacteroidales bacterium]
MMIRDSLWFHLYNILCHLRMTPYGATAQQVNDAPYTTPARKGLKIGLRAYRRNLIFSGPLLRTSLNGSLQVADWPFYA